MDADHTAPFVETVLASTPSHPSLAPPRGLVSEVSLDHVGVIFGIEMSRLARSNKDWHQLLELCALFRTLIADVDGIYDRC